MQLHRPDPEYTASDRAARNFILALRLAAMFVLLVWLVHLLGWLVPWELRVYGLRPREAIGLLGVLSAPFLHADLAHLTSNTVPLFVGMTATLFLYPHAALRALPMILLGSGVLAWLFARPNVHIGASGLVYGILAFVFASGLLRRDLRSVGVSLMVWFLYGSLIWGVLPLRQTMSWELHLSGALAGLLAAWLWRHLDHPPRKRYDWDDEEPESNGDSPTGPFDER